MYSLFQHPFITYTFVLSSALAVVAAVALRLSPPRGAHRTWLHALPLVVPILSYGVNYVIIGKMCEFTHGYHSYIGALRDLPSYHLLCRLNYRMAPLVAPVSLAWLAASLAMHGFAWHRTRRLLGDLPVISEGDLRAELALDEICKREGMRPPAVKVLDCDRPLVFAGGFGGRVITVSTGALNLLDDSELRAALAHELAHIQRRGHVLNWFLLLCRNLALFSPAAVWSYAAFRSEEEKNCDALAASRTGLGVELASAIVKFMRHGRSASWAHPVASLFASGDPGAARVECLLEPSTTETGHPWWACAVLLVSLIGLVFIC